MSKTPDTTGNDYRNWEHSTAYARRLEGGRPAGEPFPISTATIGGHWIMLSGNIAVWNGGAVFDEHNDIDYLAITACELPLPGVGDVGDVNQDGRLNVTDAVAILSYLFQGGWRPRLRLADADADERIGLNDALVILRYLFQHGARPGTPVEQ